VISINVGEILDLVERLMNFHRAPEEDSKIRGAAEIYARASAWGHLPPMMEFSTFLAAMERGDDPFTRRMCGGEEAAIEN
jgi:hypothetical protein